jgi:hypothetical protein
MSGRINWESTDQLRSDVVRLVGAFPDGATFFNDFVKRFDDLCKKRNCPCPCKSVCRPVLEAVGTLYRAEQLTTPPPFSPALIDTAEGARYRDQLLALHRKAERPDTTLDGLHWTLINFFLAIMQHLPPFGFDDSEGPFTVPLVDVIDVAQVITDITAPFLSEGIKTLGLFSPLRAQLLKNQLEASNNNPKKLIAPADYDGTAAEKIRAYLKDTPLVDIFNARLPFDVPDTIRFEHTHILGGSGHGKTTLLTHQFLADVQTDAAIIVIDGKGTLVKELQHLKVFEGSDRLVVIRPQDAPALNMFVPPKEEYENAIANFGYIFASKEFKLTAKQATCFSYCARLLFSMNGANIHTLLDLLADKSDRFKSHIERQSPIVQRFFIDLFYHPTEYGETKRQIQNRIFDLLENPPLYSMFSAQECKLDMGDILRSRKILLVDSSPNALGEKAAPLLGRYIIALALNAAHARLHIPKENWTPCWLVVDEAQMFVDEEKTQPLLQQAREFNLGVVLAHQKLADLTPTLAATFAANTSMRYAGGVSAQDASFMAKNMNCEPDFILGMERRKTSTTTTFACYVRGYTNTAVALTIQLPPLNTPKMSDDAYAAFMAQNRERLAATPEAKKLAPGSAPAPKPIDPAPIAATRPDFEAPTEAGKDW